MRVRIQQGCLLGMFLFASACGEQAMDLTSPGEGRANEGPDSVTPQPFGVSAAPSTGPIDDRPVTLAPVTPPPIAGGTLFVTSDGALGERDLVSAVDLETRALLWTAKLDPGDRPGRVAASSDGNLHVALRGAGDIATFDRDGVLLQRTPVCSDPTGLAFSEARSALLVACREGLLVTVALADRAVVVRMLEPDLRDVVVVQDDATDPPTESIYVTRWRSAEVLRLGEDLSSTARLVPSAARIFDTNRQLLHAPQTPVAAATNIDMDPSVGWRAAPTSDGFVFLHQRGRRQSVAVADTHVGAYGSTESGVPCSPISGPAATFVGVEGVLTSSRQLSGRLFVDVAASADGLVAFAEAGSPDPDAPTSFIGPHSDASGPGDTTSERVNGVTVSRSGKNVPVVSLFRRSALEVTPTDAPSPCDSNAAVVTTPEYNQAVAVAFNPIRPFQLVALLREPAQLLIAELDTGEQFEVPLSDLSMRDTGHDLFHQSTSSGLACASCHPEGGEDGRVWLFNEVEQRRTQSLEVGLRGTGPFHWRGEFEGVDSLMAEVFFLRMGGVLQNEVRVNALAEFIFQLESPVPIRDATDPLVVEGKALFESEEVGCATCHAGTKFTDNRNYDVGTGELLQVPSLVGVAYRAPLMHDGCAEDLWARFEPSCGGDRHGSTSQLTVDQVNALVAYMESL